MYFTAYLTVVIAHVYICTGHALAGISAMCVQFSKYLFDSVYMNIIGLAKLSFYCLRLVLYIYLIQEIAINTQLPLFTCSYYWAWAYMYTYVRILHIQSRIIARCFYSGSMIGNVYVIGPELCLLFHMYIPPTHLLSHILMCSLSYT